MDVMKPLLRLQCWQTVIILAFMIILAVTLAARNLGLVSVPILPKTFPSVVSYNVVVAHHPPPSSTQNGAHNFRQLNRVITEYDDDVAARLATLVERRATAADPDLIRLIVDMLDPPSTHMGKLSRHLVNTPQSDEVDKIFKQKVNAGVRRKIPLSLTYCFVAVQINI